MEETIEIEETSEDLWTSFKRSLEEGIKQHNYTNVPHKTARSGDGDHGPPKRSEA